MTQLPAFIAFTGVDRPQLLSGMKALSAQYPIEWGILVDDTQSHKQLFPTEEQRSEMLCAGGLRWAAHVCGGAAKQIVNSPENASVDVTGFQRIQINHTFLGSEESHIENAFRFGRLKGVRTLLQCSGAFPNDPRVDWLFDVSFGTGAKPQSWPGLPESGAFCGFSGGLNPQNVAEIIGRIGAKDGDLYWIDMESGIRTDGWLDLSKCEAVCRAVYGEGSALLHASKTGTAG